MNIGTRVRLLNEVGEGIVSGMDRSGMVLVMMDDGFEIPYHAKQLVVVGISEHAPATHVQTSAPLDDSLKNALYIAFTLDGMLKEPTIGVRLINRRTESLFAALYGEEDKYLKLEGVAVLTGGSSKVVITGALSRILSRDRFLIQLLPLPNESNSIPVSWSGYIKHQVPAMADASSWPTLNELAQRGLLFEVYPPKKSESGNIPNKDKVEQRQEIKKNWLLVETKDGIFETDLHIEELVESTAGMDNSGIITFQLRHFEKCVDEARQRNLKRFVAIHGIGKGRLKEELIKWLKAEDLDYYDASFKNYGYGAIEVRIK